MLGWDPPGYGRSRPPVRRWDNFFREDAHLAVLTMTALGYSKFSLAGWSDGGITALIAAAQHPRNIHRLVLWGSNAYISQWDIDNINQVADVSQWSERMRKPMEEMYGDSFPSLWSGWCQAYRVEPGGILSDIMTPVCRIISQRELGTFVLETCPTSPPRPS